jgi:hypothetical protein
MGMRAVRQNNAFLLSYGQAVQTGVAISLITAILVAFFGFLYCELINPGYAAFMVKDAEKTLAASGAGPEEIREKLIGVRREFSTSMQVIQALIGQSVVGTLISLILGLFLRTKGKKSN